MIDQDVGRYHSLGISGLRVDIWNFSGSELHSYRGKSPSSSKKDPITMPRMHAENVAITRDQSCTRRDLLFAKYNGCAGNFGGAQQSWLRLTVLPAPAVLCKIPYSGSGVSNLSSVHHERLMETRQSYGITPSHFSTAISSVFHANFWLQHNR
jgi:hypothetical protein